MRNNCKLFVMLIILIGLFACDRGSEKRKIKLSDVNLTKNQNKQFTSTIRLEPKERRTIAVMFFQNLTGDQNLQWLQKGLTEMLIRALSQSSSLSILSTDRLMEVIERVGVTRTSQDVDLEMAAVVGREANVEAVLVGQIKKKGNALAINVRLQEPNQGLILKEESVEGNGLDAIFSMVDELTQKVKNDLQLTFEKAEAMRGISDITTNNLDAWREYSMGVDLINKYLHADAIPYFEKAVELDSNFAAAILDLYPHYMKTGKAEQGLQLFKKLMQLKPTCTKNEQFEIDLIAANLNNDDLKFLETLENWLESCPTDRDAYMMMANVYRTWNNQEQEMKCLEKVIEIDPKYKVAYNRMGYAFANMGDYDNAIAAIQQYKELAPDEQNPYDSAGEIYLLFGEYDKAKQNFERSLEINDKFLASYMKLGHLYSYTGQYEKALKMYQQHFENASNSWERSDGNFMTGNTYLLMENKEKAREYYKKVLEDNPYHSLCLDLIGETYILPEDSNEVNEELQKVYASLKAKLTSETEREHALESLVGLSIFRNINRLETIEILKFAIKELEKSTGPSVELYLSNTKFMLSILYGKERQYDQIDPLWTNQEIVPAEFWRFLGDVHNSSFSTQWTYFGLLNRLFYGDVNRGIEFYPPLIKYANQNKAQSMEMMYRLFLADLYKKADELENFRQEQKMVGVPSEKTWMVIGPFDYNDGFRKSYPPEKKIKLNKTYSEKSWQVNWQHANDEMEDGYINFKENFKKNIWKVAYGLIYIDSPIEQEVQFRFGTDEGSKVWLNDREIWKLNRSSDAIFDAYKRTVKLNKGMNKVLIKVCNTYGNWGFFFRVTDDKGTGLEDIRFVAADEVSS